MDELGQEFLTQILIQSEKLKDQADRAMAQLNNHNQYYWKLNKEDNSIAMLIHHLSGNMRSRWTDFLTTDGEKADRNRPSEFDPSFEPAEEELQKVWEDGWRILIDTIQLLTPADLMKIIYIRKEPHSVVNALLRQLTHYANHIGQITMLAKMQLGAEFSSLSIPRDAEIFDYRELKR